MNDTVFEIRRKKRAEVQVVEIDINSEAPEDAIVAMLESQGQQVAEAELLKGADGRDYLMVYFPSVSSRVDLSREEVLAYKRKGEHVPRSHTVRPRTLFRIESRDPLRVVQLSRWSSDIFPPHLREGN